MTFIVMLILIVIYFEVIKLWLALIWISTLCYCNFLALLLPILCALAEPVNPFLSDPYWGLI
jgi:hypothetical protein